MTSLPFDHSSKESPEINLNPVSTVADMDVIDNIPGDYGRIVHDTDYDANDCCGDYYPFDTVI